ncbi:MAG TPA: hypothetical protein VFU94_13910 [Conexibacter sp.]|nr:hypothetical protein [Conexibacter sp.]
MTLLVLVLLTSELPDPGAPMFPGICAGYGGFVAGLLAWRRRLSIGPRVTGGSVVGFGVGLLCWLTALAIDRL